MDRSPLNRLSAEILYLIINTLSSSDCRALRRTCQFFNTLAVTQAFSDLHVTVLNFLYRQRDNQEGFPNLVAKYGPLVQTLTVSGHDTEDCPESPLEVNQYLVELPNLRTLCLYGETPEFGPKNRFAEACALFKQASLLTPPEERTFQHLRTLKADVSGLMGKLWALPFIMDGLETLHLINLTLDKRDPIGLPTKYHGQTNLKTLILDSSYIDVVVLTKLLAYPRALTRLELDHRSDEWEEEEDRWTAVKVYAAILQHSASLEVLKLRCTDETVFEEWEMSFVLRPQEYVPPPHVYEETGGVFDLSARVFPRLRVYDGLYVDSSGAFVPEKR